MGVLVRHWRGETPLLTSIFVTAILGTAVFVAALRLLLLLATNLDLSVAMFARMELLFFAACAAFWLWACIGIWRAARRASGQARWFTQGAVVLATLAMAPHAFASGEMAGELALLAVDRDPLGPPAKVIRTGETVVLEGAIAQRTAERFEAALGAWKDARLLVLSSEGGRMAEAFRIAELVRERGLDTIARGECSSACTIILLAGRKRSIEGGTQVGFHRTSFAGFGPLDEELASEALGDFYIESGVAADFVKTALSVPSEDIWYPSKGEMIEAQFLTAPVSQSEPSQNTVSSPAR